MSPDEIEALMTTDNPDAAFFFWLENTNISLLSLNGAAFEASKDAYQAGVKSPTAGQDSAAKAGRVDDAMGCRALGVHQAELEAVADFVGYPHKPMDAVYADDDGCISTDDLKYLAKKKAVRDWAMSQGRLVGDCII